MEALYKSNQLSISCHCSKERLLDDFKIDHTASPMGRAPISTSPNASHVV